MARILITGAGGYVGGRLARLLKQNGHDIFVVLRPQSSDLALTRFIGKSHIKRFHSYQELKEIILAIQPSILVHLACCYGRAGESETEILQSNLMLGVSLIEVSISLGYPIKFINTDSCLERNVSSYALSKAQFADWGKLIAFRGSNSLTFVNIRLQQFYGPGDDRTKFPCYIVSSCFKNVQELKLTAGTQLRDFIYIDDVLSAFLAIIDNVKNSEPFIELDLGTGISIQVKEFVKTAHELIGSSTNLLFGAIPCRLNEPEDCVADTSLMRSIGWSPKFSLVQGLNEMISFEANLEHRK